ncbi:MAG: TetR/AcrR family transcriptional regulator [Treponema sp.]|nr:TetR/AcrR family transcriptional regulator [Treponema sp.]
MAILVEHDKRKQEILEKALDVFINEGYQDVTFQKIADRCGITRTTLYIYFNNKREIFLWSIKQLLSSMEVEFKEIQDDESLSAEEALRKVCRTIIDRCSENVKLFNVLLNYFMQLKKTGVNPGDRIRRRVVKLRHLLTSIIIRGIQEKEFKDDNVHDMNELLYGLFEACIFRLTVLTQNDIEESRKLLDLAINGFLI